MVTHRPWFPIKAEKEDDPKNCRPGHSNGAFLLLAEALGGYSLEWPIRGGSARKGYLFQASGI